MSVGGVPSRRQKSGRRRVVQVVLGLAFIGAGLLVFRYASEIAGQIGGVVSPPPEGGNVTGLGSQFFYLPLIVWGFGITLIGLGGNALRMALLSSAAGGMGGAMGGGMSPEMLDGYMQQAMTANRAMAEQAAAASAAPREVVKVKCRNCGNLEAEDAAFCRKCGQPL